MKCDFKFWYIKRDDNGFITEAAIRFYEGDITPENEFNLVADKVIPVIRYRRFRRLQETDLTHLGKTFAKELNGNNAVLYTPKDFGAIKTDNELREYLNKELAKDPIRIPIKEQEIKQWQT